MKPKAEIVDAEYRETPAALAVVTAPPPPQLFQSDDPVEIIEKATRVANALKSVMTNQGLISNISGKAYPTVQAWQTCAAMLNITTICEWTRPVENGWEARVVVHDRHGRIIGAADSQCTTSERMWASRDDFARRSMAQTRATGKALRSVLGFIMSLSGFEATPAEEMPEAVTASPAPRETKPPANTQAQIPVTLLTELFLRCKFDENLSLGKWLAKTVGYTEGSTLTDRQRQKAKAELESVLALKERVMQNAAPAPELPLPETLAEQAVEDELNAIAAELPF